MRKLFRHFIFIYLLTGFTPPLFACDSCGCTLAKVGDRYVRPGQNNPWFFDFTMEQQNWRKKDAQAANDLINEGHDFHDKTHEEFYHFMLGANPVERLTVLAEIPYVTREAIEVEDADHLGEKQHSEGWGDLSLIGLYKVWTQAEDFLAAEAGVKFPTGATNERNFQGELFEVELQPGSGSYDYPVGIVYRRAAGPVVLNGNVSYVIKTQGAREFEYAGLFFASLNAELLLDPESESFRTRVGIAMNCQHEGKQTDHGQKKGDSGQSSVFMGPSLNLQLNDTVAVFGNWLFPVYQVTGGVHQKMENSWTAGARISW